LLRLPGESANSLLGSPSMGSFEIHERKGSRRGPKYPRRTLVGEMLRPWKEGQGPFGSQLEKGPIESGMS